VCSLWVCELYHISFENKSEKILFLSFRTDFSEVPHIFRQIYPWEQSVKSCLSLNLQCLHVAFICIAMIFNFHCNDFHWTTCWKNDLLNISLLFMDTNYDSFVASVYAKIIVHTSIRYDHFCLITIQDKKGSEFYENCWRWRGDLGQHTHKFSKSWLSCSRSNDVVANLDVRRILLSPTECNSCK
jgi:hypothetical protein